MFTERNNKIKIYIVEFKFYKTKYIKGYTVCEKKTHFLELHLLRIQQLSMWRS